LNVGHVKCNIVAKALLSDKKYQHMCPGHENIYQPVVKKYDLILSYPEESDGDNGEITGLVCMSEESDDEVRLNYDGNHPLYREVVEKFKEIEEKEEDKEVVISIIQATVGEKLDNLSWEHTIVKVATRAA